MKHILGTKVDYYKLLQRRKHPIKNTDDWFEKLGNAKRIKIAILLVKQEGRCHYCQKNIELKLDKDAEPLKHHATLDHVVPRVKGGTDSLKNLVASCLKCNVIKSDMSYEKFMKMIGTYSVIDMHGQLDFRRASRDMHRTLTAEQLKKKEEKKNSPKRLARLEAWLARQQPVNPTNSGLTTVHSNDTISLLNGRGEVYGLP